MWVSGVVLHFFKSSRAWSCGQDAYCSGCGIASLLIHADLSTELWFIVFFQSFQRRLGGIVYWDLEGPLSSCWAPPQVLLCIFSPLPAARSFPGVPLAAGPDTGCPPCSIQPSVCAPDRPKHTISLVWFAAVAAVAAMRTRSERQPIVWLALVPAAQWVTQPYCALTASPASVSSLQRLR